MTARQLAVLCAGVVAIAWSAPLIRLASPAPALTIATLRLVISAPPMVALALAQRRSANRDAEAARAAVGMSLRDGALLVLSAVALAGHFAFWVASVQRTSILASVVLVTMQPLFVAIGAWLALGERPSRGGVAGIALGILGAALLVGQGGSVGTIEGDVLALIGGVLSSVYLVVGRGARRRLSTATYGAIVYSIAAVVLLGVAWIADAPLAGQPHEAVVFIVLLALVPQLIGHNALNWALGSLSAAVVAVAILGEPVGAALIGATLLHEVPGPVELLGGAIVLAGVYVALRGVRSEAEALRDPLEV